MVTNLAIGTECWATALVKIISGSGINVSCPNARWMLRTFIEFRGPVQRDLFQSAFPGDLFVIAYYDSSRNRAQRKLIGREIHANDATHPIEFLVEGVDASKECAPILKRSNINMPTITTVHRNLLLRENPFHEFELMENQFN